MSYELHHGDCLATLPTLDPDSIDACVTDPPYGLAFMGKEWDHGVPGEDFWREVLRVLKPGAHLLAFGGTRTFHRLTCAIEDAGFEIRDCLSWLYGSGFPKSKNVSLAIDKREGHPNRGRAIPTASRYQNGTNQHLLSNPVGYYEARTDLARQWTGWGTALKPAWEPIILARKPLTGTVAANVERWGVGGLNIDGTRVQTDRASAEGVGGELDGLDGSRQGTPEPIAQGGPTRSRERGLAGCTCGTLGRWPANLLLDEEAAAMLDEQTGTLTSGSDCTRTKTGTFLEHGGLGHAGDAQTTYGDSGGASRFFYTAKSPRRERNAGADDLFVTLELEVCPCGESMEAATSLERAISEWVTGQESQECSTSSSGSLKTGQFLTVTVSTTSTETSKTTVSKTSPVWTSPPISESIAGVFRTIQDSGINLAASAESLSLSLTTTNEQAESVHGARSVVSETPLRISASVRRQGNIHPTCKPLALMRYLCRLITPPGGTVLDPFMGSGSTGCAAVAEGFEFVGIEREAEYIEISRRRIEHHEAKQLCLVSSEAV